MANPPPPYANITGISRTVMKDNAQETLGNYDGNARPGELTMDLTTDPPTVYIGNNLGQLTLLTFGGSGNGVPGGPNASIQFNNGNGGFGGSANLLFDGTNVISTGNVNASYFNASNGVVAVGNVVGGNINTSGNVTTNYLIASGGNTVINSTISTTGNIIGGNLNTAGNVTSNYVIASGGNTIINASISTTGNIYGGNISTAGNVYANNIIGNTPFVAGNYGAFHSDYDTALTAGINSNSTAPIAVTSTAGWPTSGALLIEEEVIGYTGIAGNTFTGITRGIAGTSGATHSNGTTVGFAQYTPANTPATVIVDSVDYNSGITLNTTTHEVTIVNAGLYNIQFSVQAVCADNAPDNIAVWFVNNGTPIPSSASYLTIQQIHAGELGAAIMAVNLFNQFAAGDLLTLEWTSVSGSSVLASYPPVGATIPSSPAVILTVNQIA